MRGVVRFLDKDGSGTVDVRELDHAVREFRILSRDKPSLGAGPMTVVDASELDLLAEYSSAQMMRRYHPLAGNEGKSKQARDRSGDDGEGYRDNNEGEQQRPATGYMTGIDGTDDVPFPCENARDDNDAEKEDKGHDQKGEGERGASKALTVADISEAFEEALRAFKTGGGDSSGVLGHPAAQQPSPDTRRAQVYATTGVDFSPPSSESLKDMKRS